MTEDREWAYDLLRLTEKTIDHVQYRTRARPENLEIFLNRDDAERLKKIRGGDMTFLGCPICATAGVAPGSVKIFHRVDLTYYTLSEGQEEPPGDDSAAVTEGT